MKAKTIFAAAFFAASAAGLAAPAPAQAESLYLYTWADFFPAQVLKDFTKETGIEVTQTNYDSVVIPETKLMAGASGFDVVLTAGFTSPRLMQAGVLKELDHSKLPNIANIDPDFAKRQMAMTDPEMRYTIPLDFGVTTIVYNADKVKQILGPNAPTDSLALLFDPANAEKLQSCGISMLDSAADTMNAALLYVGVKDVYRPTDDDLKRAAAALKAIRPYVRYYDNVRYAQDLGSGDICVALGWNFDAVRVAQNAADTGHPIDLKVMMPKQGMAGWSDRLVVPKDAPHTDAALAFINFLMKGESAAAFTQNSLIATPNTKAAAFLDPKLKDNPGIFPPADRLSSILPDFSYSSKVERDNTRYFTAVKTGN